MASQTELLDIPVEFEYFGKSTTLPLRDYLRMLLSDLWERTSQFDGKRPYGSSIWKSDVFIAMIKSGHIAGGLDENGWVGTLTDEEEQKADEMVHALIRDIFRRA